MEIFGSQMQCSVIIIKYQYNSSIYYNIILLCIIIIIIIIEREREAERVCVDKKYHTAADKIRSDYN